MISLPTWSSAEGKSLVDHVDLVCSLSGCGWNLHALLWYIWCDPSVFLLSTNVWNVLCTLISAHIRVFTVDMTFQFLL